VKIITRDGNVILKGPVRSIGREENRGNEGDRYCRRRQGQQPATDRARIELGLPGWKRVWANHGGNRTSSDGCDSHSKWLKKKDYLILGNNCSPHAFHPTIEACERRRVGMAKMVLVVDDSRWIRERLGNLFDSAEGFEVCGEAGNGREGVEKAEQLQPDLIILDLSMPVMNGIDAARILHRILPSVPVILFRCYSGVFQEEEAKSVGISALVSKDEALAKLVGKARSLFEAHTE